MNNLQVHRINFFEPDPLAIRCISYDCSISRLAVSRADASIEIWDVQKNPYLEKVISYIPTGSVETLSWCEGRLFSSGLYGYISEYDLTTLSEKYQLLVTTGCPIWCMAVNEEKTTLAVGNEDGHVILHDITPEGLNFQKKFDKQEGSILCLTWHKKGHIIVTGSLDTIRVWSVDTGHVCNRIIIGRASKNTPTVVWCISMLSDMTIVSGDSRGKTSFWDGNTGTLLSSQSIHKEDVLALCATETEGTIFTSGVDPIIQSFVQSRADGKWLKNVKRVVHTHDVRALQHLDLDSFLVSGGDDCNLVFTKYPPKTTIKFFPYCQMSYSVVAPDASCILLRYPKYLEMWRIVAIPSESSASQKLLQIKAKSNEVIACSSVSCDGKWIAYSSQSQMRLFSISLSENSSDIPVITKVLLPEGIPNSASILLFTSKPTKLLQYSRGKIYIIKCEDEQAKVDKIIEEDEESDNQTYIMEVSDNGLYLACGSHNGSVIIYCLKSQKVVSKLPQYEYQPTALKFDPSSENLIVAYSDRKVIEYCIKRNAYTSWSKKQFLLKLQEASYYPIMSIVYCSDKLFLSDENSIYVFNKVEQVKPDRKRTRLTEKKFSGCGDDDDDTYTCITKYEHISRIHSFFNDLVVVQMAVRYVENALPPPIWKKKFGT